MGEPRLAVLLGCYAICSFTYSLLCGLYRPPALGGFQTYALVMPLWFAAFAVVHRARSRTRPRLWPPTKQESLAALGAALQLSAETVALMMPASLVAVVAAKGGCLLLPDKRRKTKPVLALVALCAVALASVHKPLRLLLVPLILAAVYLVGCAIKLYACETAKDDDAAKPGFLAAGQVLVIFLANTLSSAASRFAPPAPLSLHVFLIAGASMGCGLLGTAIVTHSAPRSMAFPAYRSVSLICALMASVARGEPFGRTDALAALLALAVVLHAGGATSAVKSAVKAWYERRSALSTALKPRALRQVHPESVANEVAAAAAVGCQTV